MPEPTTNARVTRSLRRVFYNFTRRYGVQIVLSKVNTALTNETNYTTGVRTRNYTDITIRRAVLVPSTTARDVTFTPAMMQAVRQYAWQGGAGTDKEMTSFLVADQDMRGWGEVDSTQFLTYNGKGYEVAGANHFDGGVIINCSIAKGSRA